MAEHSTKIFIHLIMWIYHENIEQNDGSFKTPSYIVRRNWGLEVEELSICLALVLSVFHMFNVFPKLSLFTMII